MDFLFGVVFFYFLFVCNCNFDTKVILGKVAFFGSYRQWLTIASADAVILSASNFGVTAAEAKTTGIREG